MAVKQYDGILSNKFNSSDIKILDHIKPCSVILEFGPAYGKFTKYMKNNLNCKVFIVEIDKEAFDSALQYAEDGICGNIYDYLWLKKFNNISFDYIIYADVLEHLFNPEEVLLKSISLLKDNGSVLLSVPNIAHSSIIINLINNKFEYNDIGLLDRNHIRFFTYSSLIKMLDNCSLVPIIEDGVVIHPKNTEFHNSYSDIAGNAEIIESNIYVNIYQFIFKCVKKSFYIKNNEDSNIIKLHESITPVCCRIYFDKGKGIDKNDVNVYKFNENKFEIIVNLTPDIKSICFEPFMGRECIINNLKLITDMGVIKYTYTNGIEMDDIIIFGTLYPKIIIDFHGMNILKINITGDVDIINPKYINIINNMLNSKSWRITKPLRKIMSLFRRKKSPLQP